MPNDQQPLGPRAQAFEETLRAAERRVSHGTGTGKPPKEVLRQNMMSTALQFDDLDDLGELIQDLIELYGQLGGRTLSR